MHVFVGQGPGGQALEKYLQKEEGYAMTEAIDEENLPRYALASVTEVSSNFTHRNSISSSQHY